MLVLDMQVMKKYLDQLSLFLNYALGWFSSELLGAGFMRFKSKDRIVFSFVISNSKKLLAWMDKL
jgi:hypothetical protein